MTTTDWILDSAFILIVFLQLREQRFTARTILLPLAIIGFAAAQYLHSVPTAGNDLVLIGVFAVVGGLFGAASGLFTRVGYRDGAVRIRATAVAAALWVISMGFRMAFAVWASQHAGLVRIASFSAAHSITGPAWVTAIIFMAFAEVLVRLGTMVVRAQRIGSASRPSAAYA